MPPKMPPTRRKSSNPTSARVAQPTLTFHSRSNKVTKPNLPSTSEESKLVKVKPEEVLKAVELATPSPGPEDGDVQTEHGSTTAELAIKEQVKIEQATPKSAADERAEKITDAQIKRYWKAKEDERKAPRGMSSYRVCSLGWNSARWRSLLSLFLRIVHQEGLSVHDKILREFDLSSQYGVSNAYLRVPLSVMANPPKAMCRHRADEAMEAGRQTWVEAPDRGTFSPQKRGGEKQHQSSEGARR